MKKLKKGLTKTREQFIDRVGTALTGRAKIDDTLIDDIEDIVDAIGTSRTIVLASLTPRTDIKDATTTALNILLEDLFLL